LAMPNVLAAHWAIKGVTPVAIKRTRRELRAAVVAALADPVKCNWSNVGIADVVGCSDTFVGIVRNELASRAGERVVGKDGKSYPARLS